MTCTSYGISGIPPHPPVIHIPSLWCNTQADSEDEKVVRLLFEAVGKVGRF